MQNCFGVSTRGCDARRIHCEKRHKARRHITPFENRFVPVSMHFVLTTRTEGIVEFQETVQPANPRVVVF